MLKNIYIYVFSFLSRTLFTIYFFCTDILAVVISALDRKQITKDGRESSVQKFVLVNEEYVFLSLMIISYIHFSQFQLWYSCFSLKNRFQTVKLSMWDAFVDDEGQKILQSMHRFPVVICRRVRVGYYNGPLQTLSQQLAVRFFPLLLFPSVMHALFF